MIGSVKRCDLVKIKQRSHKQSFRLRLRFRRLRSSEIQIVRVVSTSGRKWKSVLFFRFCLRLRQCGFHEVVSNGVISAIRRKWKRSDSCDFDFVALTTPLFNFHKIASALTTPITTPTLTPSLLKTSLKLKERSTVDIRILDSLLSRISRYVDLKRVSLG